MTETRMLTVLGSTGSIGTQTLDVVRQHPDRFRIAALTCGKNVERLAEQIREFRPRLAVCGSQEDAARLRSEFPDTDIDWGAEGLVHAAEADGDIVLNALMGMRGLVPTYHAICAGKDIALANKETLVAGGRVVTEETVRRGVKLLPVDSEHSAIFQCLEGNRGKKIRKILLTASGGPFRGWTSDRLKTVTPAMALRHPNWSMGRKITIDSATMMNKGLEIIEARWLFDVPERQIEVYVHPQSIVHSAVEFDDTSVLAQLGIPDMRIPISVALGYPERLRSDGEELDLFGKSLTFERPDEETFRCLAIARRALREGGDRCVVMNAANEILVQAFLDGKIGFTDIPAGIERTLGAMSPAGEPGLDEILAIDREARERTERMIACGR